VFEIITWHISVSDPKSGLTTNYQLSLNKDRLTFMKQAELFHSVGYQGSISTIFVCKTDKIQDKALGLPFLSLMDRFRSLSVFRGDCDVRVALV